MKRVDVQQWFFNLVAVAFCVGALLGTIWLIAKAIDKGATFLAGTLAALATIAAAGLARYFERRKDGEAARRQHLGKLYEDFASAMAGEARPQRSVLKTMLQISPENVGIRGARRH